MSPRQFSALLDRRQKEADFHAALFALTPWTISAALAPKNRTPKFDDFVLTRNKRG